MPPFLLRLNLDKAHKQKNPHHQDSIWNPRQKPQIADRTTDSESDLELAPFKDSGSAQKQLYPRVPSKLSTDSALQSSHFCCILVCLSLCFLSKLILLLLLSMPHLAVRLYPQPFHWAFSSSLPSLISSPSSGTLSLVLHLPLLTVGVREGKISTFFPIPLPPPPNHNTSPSFKDRILESILTSFVVLFSFSSWSLSFICSFAKWQ